MNKDIELKISSNYNKYLKIAKNLSNGKDDPRDILQECLMNVCELDIEKQNSISSYFEYYLIQMIKYSSISKTSKYQQKYNKVLLNRNISMESLENFDIIEEDEEPKITMKDINKVLNEHCNWYEREVFLQYVNKDKTFKQFEKETGIPASSLFNTYKKVKQILKENL